MSAPGASKAIEADRRKRERARAESLDFLAQWDHGGSEPMTMARATAIASLDHCSRCYPLADYPRHPPERPDALAVFPPHQNDTREASQLSDLPPAQRRTSACALLLIRPVWTEDPDFFGHRRRYLGDGPGRVEVHRLRLRIGGSN